MKPPGRIQSRLAAAIVLTALIPLLAAIYLARSAIIQTSDRFFRPEIQSNLDRSLEVYKDLARSQKAAMRYQAAAIAGDAELRRGVQAESREKIRQALRRLFREQPGLVSLAVEDADGDEVAGVNRGRPVDDAEEYELVVEEPLSDTDEYILRAIFATDQDRFRDRDRMSQFVDEYARVAERRRQDEQSYVMSFGVLLGFTILLAILVGTWLARGVSSRMESLAAATKRVGAGDLDTRVDEQGSDEVAELARAFNRMLVEVQANRARIEYLQRIGAWQEMARRLAHEIKNPLTPIQLAVQEIHERYRGPDSNYRKLLDATLEVVEAEVGTLRRLVTEFSDFARLPEAHLERADWVEVLQEQADRASLLETELSDGIVGLGNANVEVSFQLPSGPAFVKLDRQMMGRVLNNLVRNAAQAISETSRPGGRIEISLEEAPGKWRLTVDDDGPGIPDEIRERLFDPYVTTKTEGTGLGLAIVKKIVVEHGGAIEAGRSPLGGARMQIVLDALEEPSPRLDRLTSEPRRGRPEAAPGEP